MQVKVIAIKEQPSRHGGKMYVVCMHQFVPVDRSLMTYVYPGAGNYVRWKRVINLSQTHEVVLDGLSVLKGRLINADSLFNINHEKTQKIEKEKEATCPISK